MGRSSTFAVALPVTLAALTGCGGTKEGVDFDHGSVAPGAQGDGIGVQQARVDYPEAPYGTQEGDVIPNYQFLGWSRPADASYDTAALVPISLGDSYDPDGVKGVRLLVVTAGAVWCSACKLEYKELASGIVGEYEKRGVNFLGTLFEDNDGAAARPSDLRNWAKTYKVNFPFVLDPSLKLGAYFSVEATPTSMIIDTTTMKIVAIETGWAGSGEGGLWDYLDSLLAQ